MKTERFHICSIIVCSMVALATGSACAELVVNRAIVVFDSPSQHRQDVELVNIDAGDNLFVDIESFQVERPGEDDQALTSLRGNENPGLIATPQKAMIGPSNSQLVRFMNLDRDGDREKVFRVNMTPVTRPPEFDAGDVARGETASQIQIVIGYQVLVIVPPVDPRAVVDYGRSGSSATFKNSGNSNYLLTDGRQCDPDAPEVCMDLVSYRVYPGNHRQVELPFDGPFSYKIRTVAGITSQRFE
ncbi:MAG TPA: fimbria/pilus periplasmic chaperone [Pseudomonadales bacterium]